MEDFGLEDLDDDRPAPQQTQERAHAPEGVHDFQIVRVTNQEYGFDLALALEDRRHGWVFHRMERARDQTAYRLRELLRSLEISLEEWRQMDPTDLVGRRIRAEIRHKVGNDGRLWKNVWKYLPTEQLVEQPPAAQAPPRPARTPAAKVKQSSPAVAADADDIPF